MTIQFSSRWLGLITLVWVMGKLFVPGFDLAWVWVVSPLWIVAGFICVLDILHVVIGKL